MPYIHSREIRTEKLREELPEYEGDVERIKKVLDVIDGVRPELKRHTRAFRLYFGLTDAGSHTLDEVGKELNVGKERARQLWLKAARHMRHPRYARMKV